MVGYCFPYTEYMFMLFCFIVVYLFTYYYYYFNLNSTVAYTTPVPSAPPAPVNIAGIWAASAILTLCVACIVVYGLIRTYFGKQKAPEVLKTVYAEERPPSKDAETNTIVTVSGNVPETYEQEVTIED